LKKTTKEQLPYLYWESLRNKPYHISLDKAFVVHGDEVATFLEKTLTTLGLEHNERNDFITYWLPTLERNKWNLISFLDKEYTDEFELQITPPPDTIIRVFMVFKNISEFIEIDIPILIPVERKGFVAVEWGGMNLDDRNCKFEP